jgi:hypothetical protein
MRNIVAIALALGVLVVAACGNSNTAESSCTEQGGICLHQGAACGDTQPFECPSSGVCCSPGQSAPSSKTPSAEPAAR